MFLFESVLFNIDCGFVNIKHTTNSSCLNKAYLPHKAYHSLVLGNTGQHIYIYIEIYLNSKITDKKPSNVKDVPLTRLSKGHFFTV